MDLNQFERLFRFDENRFERRREQINLEMVERGLGVGLVEGKRGCLGLLGGEAAEHTIGDKY